MPKEIKSIIALLFGFLTIAVSIFAQEAPASVHIIHPVAISKVKIDDPFWSPRFATWQTKTVYDVFNKMEGDYIPDRQDIIDEKQKLGYTRNALSNFDRVAKGNKNTQIHDGPPWYDGLLYETIRGAADLLITHPDPVLEKKIDGYIVRIAKAQDADPDGYIDTYTTLMYANRRWGTNGGDDKWQHDIYNAGMLAEAAVHYYLATGKTQLLNIAVKMSNYMFTQMGPQPKLNVIPGHGGPEEALLKMYRLFTAQPALKTKMSVPVNEQQYYTLAKFWIENRGNYGNADGAHTRKSDSSYNQDHLSVFEQPSIEGHAVRATLLATGVTAMAIQDKDDRYIATANRYWNNMTGKKMFITGGEGAIADGERFGASYYLPESAYLETCASIGAAFFSEQMNELHANGKYMDEFERVLYNNFLSGISIDGDRYHYENPLVATDHPRWGWHSCPCCPPMILKMAGALPGYIYATDKDGLYVNLFIGSTAKIDAGNLKNVTVKQTTQYPWKGSTRINIDPTSPAVFTVHVRIPGWAQGKENPFNLYYSSITQPASITINGKQINVEVNNGYASIRRQWRKGDVVELLLPVQPRFVTPNDSIAAIKGKTAIAAGPLIYGFEKTDNPSMQNCSITTGSPLSIEFKPGLLQGVNVVKGQLINSDDQPVSFTAIPFYSIGNRNTAASYNVWVNKK